MNKYYIFCSDGATREGWYEEFDTIEEAKKYLEENYNYCEILIVGKEITYVKTKDKIHIQGETK